MSVWRKVSLADVARERGLIGGPFGSKLVSRDYVDHGVPVVRGQNLAGGRWVTLDDCVFVTEDKVDRELRGNIAEPGDLIYTQRGTLGQVALMPPDSPAAVISQSQMRLRIDTNKADPMFVYYSSSSAEFQKSIFDHAIVAGVPHINLGILSELPLTLPPLDCQRRIASTLGTLDDLIENNRRRVAVLEEMARAIYREWFVRFRFPGHENVEMVDSVLGRTPDRWEARRVGDAARLVRGRSYRKHDLVDTGGLPFVNLKCMARGGGFRREGLKRYVGDYKSDQVVTAGDIVLAVTDLTQGREILARATLVPRLPEGSGVISLDVVRIVPLSPSERLWIFATLRWSNFAERVKEYANGSTVLHLSPSHLTEARILWPPESLRDQFVSLLDPSLRQINELDDAADTLASMRDRLLPKLVTGQVDVSSLDLDALVEGAVA